MDIQGLIVLAVVVAAAVFLGRRVFGSMSARANAPGCHGCDLGCHSARAKCSPGGVPTAVRSRDSSFARRA